jgi:opacity protein-like surface antigen
MRTLFAALALSAALCGASAEAADLPSPDLPTKKEIVAPALPSSWRYDITLYGWGTDLSSQTGVGPFPTTSSFINFLKLLEHFQGGLMGAFVARNDTFIAGLDVIVSRIGAGTNFDRPSPLFGDHATVTLTQAIVTAFGGLRIPVGPPNLQLYGTVGARYFYSHAGLDLSFPVTGFEPHFGLTKNWADPVAGITAHYVINDKWFSNFSFDLGGLDNSATGQVLGSVGYNWTSSISTTLGYRVLYTYFRDISGPLRDYRYQSWMYGPFAGFKYSF